MTSWLTRLFRILAWGDYDMAKKKREHVVFDQMLKPKKSIPFSMVNKQSSKSKKKNLTLGQFLLPKYIQQINEGGSYAKS